MDEAAPEGARTSPAAMRNREPILQVLRNRLPPHATVLEIASGSGQHAAFLAEAMPHIRWQPSDPDPEARASISAWRATAGLANLEPPLALDAVDPASWPSAPVDAIVCINMVHIAPWAAAEGLIAGAERLLPAGGKLFLYGPFLETQTPTAPSNLAFDDSLQARDAAWGLRRLEDVTALAGRHRLRLTERVAMPANNLAVVFVKG